MERVAHDNDDFVVIDDQVRKTGYQVLNWSVAGDQSVFRCIKHNEDPGEAFEITTSSTTPSAAADELVAAIRRRIEPAQSA